MNDRFILKSHLRQLAERIVKNVDVVNQKMDDVSGDVISLKTQVDEISVPTKTSQLTNDSDFQTSLQVGSAILLAVNGLTIPTKVSELLNDSDFQTGSNVEAMIKNAAYLSPEMHRMIFRGKNLGTSLTAAQKTAIQNGTFTDLWLGDYWVIGGVNWRIVDFDYWWNCGDTSFTKHHLVIMPDTNLGSTKQMNATNTTEGGYVGSLMKTTNMDDAKAKCTAAFGANILSHREYLVNAVANGRPSGGAWLDSTIELPNECMIYGHPFFTPACDGTTAPVLYTIDKTQLALFDVAPKFITTRQNYWLRDVVSAVYFAIVTYDGRTHCYYASNYDIGVRPVFPVGVS